jgi:uncharacterized damage-inducible protein DinB
MEKNISGVLKEWEFIRSCSICFIKELSDDDLNRKLPRKGLDTIRKHFQEMIEVQRDYVKAIGTSNMDFNTMADSDMEGKASKEELLEDIKIVDKALITVLEKSHENSQVSWFGHKQVLTFHIGALIAHESMHIGQIIAFCYALDIDIPKYIINNWALSGK